MNDRPSAPELLAAVRLFLEGDLLKSLTDSRLRFQTLIAANVLGIAEREWQQEEEQLEEEARVLGALLSHERPNTARVGDLRQTVLALNAELCRRIQAGTFDEPGRFKELGQILRQSLVRKLQIANPRYLASFDS